MVEQIYGNSDFVLSGRGWVNLETYRHYEASMFGAIPIVIGTEREIEHTFGNSKERAPWVYSASWSEALSRINHMSVTEVQDMRRRVLDWWIKRITAIHNDINTIVSGA